MCGVILIPVFFAEREQLIEGLERELDEYYEQKCGKGSLETYLIQNEICICIISPKHVWGDLDSGLFLHPLKHIVNTVYLHWFSCRIPFDVDKQIFLFLTASQEFYRRYSNLYNVNQFLESRR